MADTNRIFAIIRDASGEFDANIENLKTEFSKLGFIEIFDKADSDTEPKLRNRINQTFRKERNFTGFLHVVAGNAELLADAKPFIEKLEHMMVVVDYSVWFNTVCDPCNYVYNKYNPRVTVELDAPECKELGLEGRAYFTSHSNTAWIAYDMSKATDDQLRFDEDFTIAMYWIIEFLARRRNTKNAGDVYFMNQYLTIDLEKGVFRTLPSKNGGQEDQKKLQAEDKIFQAKKINYSVDNSVDAVLDAFWNKLLSKVPKKA